MIEEQICKETQLAIQSDKQQEDLFQKWGKRVDSEQVYLQQRIGLSQLTKGVQFGLESMWKGQQRMSSQQANFILKVSEQLQQLGQDDYYHSARNLDKNRESVNILSTNKFGGAKHKYLDTEKTIEDHQNENQYCCLTKDEKQFFRQFLENKTCAQPSKKIKSNIKKHLRSKIKIQTSQYQLKLRKASNAKNIQIVEIVNHNFDLEGEVHYKVLLSDQSQQIVKRNDLLLNNPQQLAVYYRKLYQRLRSI